MSARARRALAFTVAVAAVVAASSARAGAGAAQAIDPTVTIDRTGTAAGEAILITGGGWPGGASLIVELCGHGGLRGSVDCDVPHQRTAGVGPSGTFTVELTSGLPPVPCPCVIRATDQSSQIAATAPIAVAGMATVPITADDVAAVRALEISAVKISGGRWAELFGAGGRRVLEVTLVNTGPLAIDAPKVNVSWGSGSSPDGFVEPPEARRMEPGESQTLTLPLHRAALTFGEQTAVVEVQGLGVPVIASASTTGYPWGLVALGLVVLQLLLLRVRSWLRRRIQHRPAPIVEDPTIHRAVLELPPGLAALESAEVDDVVADPVVIDLEEIEREMAPHRDSASDWPTPTPTPTPTSTPTPGRGSSGNRTALVNGSSDGTATNGTTSNGVPIHGAVADLSFSDEPRVRRPGSGAAEVDHTAEAARAVQAELASLRQQAKAALERVGDLSEALLASCSEQARVLEGQTAERLRHAERRDASSIKLLTAARERADELTAAATAAAAEILRDAAVDRDDLQKGLAEVRKRRAELLEAAAEAVDEVLQELDDKVVALNAARSTSPADTPEPIDADWPQHRAPRLGGLDERLAHAVSRAFAAASANSPSRD